MPQRNTTGGKGYKKTKKGLGTNDADGGNMRFSAKKDGQDYGRVTRLLGNRRVMCFCNDGLDRVCKIRGGICRGSHNKQKIDIGDIVLISYRDYDVSEDDSEGEGAGTGARPGPGAEGTEAAAVLKSGKKDIADLLMKYERSHWRDIRKEGGVHALLFPNSGHTAMYSADDIFEDVNGSEGEGEGQGEGGGKDQDTNVETPVSDRNAVVVSKKEKTKQIHGFLDNEDLVIDDI